MSLSIYSPFPYLHSPSRSNYWDWSLLTPIMELQLWWISSLEGIQQTVNANTGLTVHCYTNWTFPIQVRGGTVVWWATPSSQVRRPSSRVWRRLDGVNYLSNNSPTADCNGQRQRSITVYPNSVFACVVCCVRLWGRQFSIASGSVPLEHCQHSRHASGG